MELSYGQVAARLRRSPRTIRRWFGNRLATTPLEKAEAKAKRSLLLARRPTSDADKERDLLGRIRFGIQHQQVGSAWAEMFRKLRQVLDQNGWQPDLGGNPDENIGTSAEMPTGLKQAILRLLPSPDAVPTAITQRVQDETADMTSRQIAWMQGFELLRTGAVPWSRFEPTNGEIRALQKQSLAPDMCKILQAVQVDWGEMAILLDIDLSYLRPQNPGKEPKQQLSAADKSVHERMTELLAKDVRAKLIQRACRRFSGHPRKASIDTDVGYLLGITRQSAFYLRRSVERRLGKARRV